MKLGFFLVLFTTLFALALAWEKEDYEIFDLVSAIEASEGSGTTFYSWLGVPSTANTNEIAKAYRKLSMRLHPDKNPGVKGIEKRFARLGVVSTILRNPESRKRYDFFYKNGVPKWKGTGYFYSRFRPGLGTVVVFLVILTSVFQYIAQTIKYKRDAALVERIITDAKTAAWGTKMIPVEGQRKVKVSLGGSTRIDEDGNLVTGRSIDMVVEGQNVYILGPDGELEPVDSSTAQKPSFFGTWFFSLIKAAFVRVKGSESSSFSTEELPLLDEKTETDDDVSTTGSVSSNGPTGLRGRRPAAKKGGRRR